MRRLTFATCLIVLPLLAYATKPPKITSTKTMTRAVDVVGRKSGAFIHDIPPSSGRDESALARDLARSLMWYRDMNKQRGKNDVVIVCSDDPAQAVRVARVAFASLRGGSLRGLRVICIVGKKHDGYLRSVAITTGARLEVESVQK